MKVLLQPPEAPWSDIREIAFDLLRVVLVRVPRGLSAQVFFNVAVIITSSILSGVRLRSLTLEGVIVWRALIEVFEAAFVEMLCLLPSLPHPSKESLLLLILSGLPFFLGLLRVIPCCILSLSMIVKVSFIDNF